MNQTQIILSAGTIVKKNGLPLALPHDTEFTVAEGNVEMIMESREVEGCTFPPVRGPVGNFGDEEPIPGVHEL